MTTHRGVNAVIQARMGSTRLPGKVLRELGGHTVLEWVVRAAQQANGVDAVIVATTQEAADDAVADEAHRCGADVVRGSAEDVLQRFLSAVAAHPCEAVVRLTADCPLLDPALIAQAVAAWRAAAACDYVATTLVRTLPRGLDVEVVAVEALTEVAVIATGHDRVHVTSGVYADPARFTLLGLVVAPPADDLRVTLDTEDDARLLDRVVAELGPGPYQWRAVVDYLRGAPDVVALNAHVEQKRLDEG